MIGETEEAVSVLKNSFVLIRNFLSFELFACSCAAGGRDRDTCLSEWAEQSAASESVPGTLIRRMRKALLEDKQVRVFFEGDAGATTPESEEDLKSVIVALSTRNKTHGCAGIYRSRPFDYYEESIFKRFCAHISQTLEKIELF